MDQLSVCHHANPLIPGWTIMRVSTSLLYARIRFEALWDSFLSQMLPVIIQAANLIVWFWRRVCVSPFFKGFGCWEIRVRDFSLTNELTLGTMSGSAKLVLSLVEPLSNKFSVILADIISGLWRSFDFSIPSLPDGSGNLGSTPQ